jgi:hypothetical protein
VFAGMIPSTSLAVDGSRRTLTWVDVVPSTGAVVGCGGGGRGVSLGRDVAAGCNVAVMGSEAGEGVDSSRMLESQPTLRKAKTINAAMANRIGTAGFYRLSSRSALAT